ncbi:hypothetical protein [Rhizobacter sp. P5_C2]
MKTHAPRGEATATQRQPAAQDASTRSSHDTAQAVNESPRMLAQRRQIENIFGPAAQRRPVRINAEPQAAPVAGHVEAAQRTLWVKSGSGTYAYHYGKDFKNDHLGGEDHAIAILKQRWKDRGLSSPVTVITELDGNHDGTDAKTLPGYQFSLNMDVEGWTANWDEKYNPVTTEISSATLSGYTKGKRGLITHVSSSG